VSSGVAQHEPSDSSPNTHLPIGITADKPDTQPGTAPDTEQGSPSQRSSAVVSSGGAQAKTSDSSPNTAFPLVPTVYPPSTPAVSRANTRPGITPDTEQTEQGGPSQRSSAAVDRAVTQPKAPHTSFLIVGLVSLVAINILFIADIELTLRRNKGNQTGDEATWGFGQ
ncbi:hypothetical protein B0H14DRAFT_3897754, partial [Mycena olivaceomarginata]